MNPEQKALESDCPEYLKREGYLSQQTSKLHLPWDRTLVISAPLVLTPSELHRIQQWIGLQFIIQQPMTPGEVNFGDFIGA